MQALREQCPDVETPKKSVILEEYSKYLEQVRTSNGFVLSNILLTHFYLQYTDEEIEWYGYTFEEAVRKMNIKLAQEKRVVPQKIEFRSRLIQQLKEAGIAEAQGHVSEGSSQSQIG